MSIFAWVVLAIIAIVAAWLTMSYNRLVAMRQQCTQAFADIDVQLKRRHDLVPSLVETVKGYASHESKTLNEVVEARNSALGAKNIPEKTSAESSLSGALRQLFAISEQYPTLKANSNFIQLQTDLRDVETRLADARRAYNAMTQANNTMVQQYPMALIARSFGFESHEFFNIGDDRQTSGQTPTIRF